METAKDKNINKIIKDYILIKCLGKGSYAQVYLGVKSDDEKVAIKVLPKNEIFGDITRVTQYENEVKAISKIDHKNIVKCFESLQSINNFYLLLEYCDGGNLEEFVQSQPSKYLEECVAIKIIQDICQGYRHIHEKGIMHRDIKAANVYLKYEDLKLIAKIGDYGFAKDVQFSMEGSTAMAQSRLGTGYYMSPELILGQDYTYKNDLFAIGVLYYFMLFGRYPFKCDSMPSLITQYSQGTLVFDLSGRKISEYSIDFITNLMQFKDEYRLNLSSVLKHPINTMEYEEISKKCLENCKIIKELNIN